MVIAFRSDVLERLRAFEETEGMPVVEQVHQALKVWSHLTMNERQMLGLSAMQLVAARARKGRT